MPRFLRTCLKTRSFERARLQPRRKRWERKNGFRGCGKNSLGVDVLEGADFSVLEGTGFSPYVIVAISMEL